MYRKLIGILGILIGLCILISINKDVSQLITVPIAPEQELPHKIEKPIEKEDVWIKTYEGAKVSILSQTREAVQAKEAVQVEEAVQGLVCFKEVPIGLYILKIEDVKGYIEPIEKVIEVREALDIQGKKQNNIWRVTTYHLSEVGKDALKKFIGEFYGMYTQAIEKQDLDLLDTYIETGHQPLFFEEFENWFLKGKNLEEVKLEVEAKNQWINEEGLSEFLIIEDCKVQQDEEQYRLYLNWRTQIQLKAGKFRIMKRVLEESSVAHYDESGRWVAY